MPAGLGAYLGNQTGKVLHAEVRRYGQHDGRITKHSGEGERFEHVVAGRTWISERRQNWPVHIVDQQRVAVGRRAGHRIIADLAAGARLVLDDDRFAEHCTEPIRENTRKAINKSAGRKRHDDLDRLLGKVLRALALRQARSTSRETERIS